MFEFKINNINNRNLQKGEYYGVLMDLGKVL